MEVSQIIYRDKFVNGQTQELEVHQVTCTVIDGEVVNKKTHTDVYAPGADVSQCAEDVQALARALWTPEAVQAWTEGVIAKHQAARDERDAVLAGLAAQDDAIKAQREALDAATQELQQARAVHDQAVSELAERIARLRVPA